MQSVAAGDENAPRPEGLAAYYTASGTPPGRFLGAGLADLDGGRGVERGSVVTEEHLRRMLVELCDPVSGEPLGGAPMKASARSAPVAGFDLTCSPSKSVSVAWVLADEQTKAVIYDCHLRAIEVVLSWAEATVFHSRSGKGGVVEEDVTGVVVTAFTHWSSRADDPQLHTHAVVFNRARSASDGRWRTLDSKALFKATTTLSELYQGVLSDLLTQALGYGFEPRRRRHSERPRYEIAGVGEDLMAHFSRRAEQVAEHTAVLTAGFVDAHGRQPSVVEAERLRSRATVATRPAKSHHSLSELTNSWRQRASAFVPAAEQRGWAASLAGRNDLPLLRASDLGDEVLADAADAVVAEVSGRRATFGRLNLLAEAHRVLHGVRFCSPAERMTVAARLTDLAVSRSLVLTPPALCHTPVRYLRADGTSRLRPTNHVLYTSRAVIDAEARLLEAARVGNGPAVSAESVAAVAAADLPGRDHRLGLDQVLAIGQVATSGRVLDLLVGPAGSGKSTAMAGLRAAWEQEHGTGSVIGLAPSAAAAEVLAAELRIPTENTAKWLTEHRHLPALTERRGRLALNLARHPHPSSPDARRLRGRLSALDEALAARSLRSGALVLVDEATLAGTLVLDEIVSAARTAGAKVVLVGDFAQLGAPAAGGAFSLLVADRDGTVAELTELRRFAAAWEADASLGLRQGEEEAIFAYESHGRVTGGERDEVLDALHAAWRADVEKGKTSLMVAADGASVAELNSRARAGYVAAGTVERDGVALAGAAVAGIGDVVVTRRNDRTLMTGRGFVKNGDRFVVTATGDDASLTLRRLGGSGEVVLPAVYVAEHVELGYATSCHRAQGQTVDTAHVLVSPAMSRELLYVAATRGREENCLYVETAFDPDPLTGHDALTPRQAAHEVLCDALRNAGAGVSAHEALAGAQSQCEDLVGLAAEYETLAQAATAPRVVAMLGDAGLGPAGLALVEQSPAFGPLVACLREAEARGLDVEQALPRLVGKRGFGDACDVAAVVHGRAERWAARTRPARAGAGFVAGVVARASDPDDADMARALAERDEAMRRRSRELAEAALARREPWVARLGPPPTSPKRHERWLEAVATVAAYRERWAVGDSHRPLGDEIAAASVEAVRHRERALAAANTAYGFGRHRRAAYASGRGQSSPDRVVEVGTAVEL
jgi:conjugative relaxase-like TrwC/TraI family protein